MPSTPSVATITRIAFEPNGDGRTVRVLTVDCPYCRQAHTHEGGTTDQPPDLGFRVPGCAAGTTRGDYQLQPAPGLEDLDGTPLTGS